jgi:hypothetical protein
MARTPAIAPRPPVPQVQTRQIDTETDMRLVQLTRISTIFLIVATAGPAQAEGPLADLLAAAPAYVAHLHNIAVNDATLSGQIDIDLNAPRLVHRPDYLILGDITLHDAPTAPPSLATSVIGTLATSVTGAMQAGTIAARFASNAPMAVPGSLGMQGANTSLAAADPNLLVSASNMGLHSGAVTGTIMVSGQNQVVQVTDQSTDVTGAISQGRIRIVIGED